MPDEAGPTQVGYRSPYYREITPDYVFGGPKPGFIEMSIVTAKTNPFEKVVNKKDVIEHTEEATLKLSPTQAKSLIAWLLQNIKIYENSYGKVELRESEETKQTINKKVDELLASL